MISYQLIQRIEFLYHILQDENNSAINFFKSLEEINNQLEESYIRVVLNQVALADYQHLANQFMVSVKDNTQLWDVYDGLKKLKENIAKYEVEFNDFEGSYLSSYSNLIDVFKDNYQDFIRNYSAGSLVKVASTGNILIKLIRNTSNWLRAITLNLQTSHQYDAAGVLSLFFEGEYDYHDVVEKLSSLQEIYSILCNLFELSEKEYPLKIIKIETGSLWVKVFGEPGVIKLIDSLIKDVSGYFYRRNTREGKLSGLSLEFETIEKTLQLKEKLEEKGIDTSGMDDEIKNIYGTLIQKTSVLIAGDREIVMYAELAPMLDGGNSNQKYLTNQNMPMLKSSEETENSPNSD